MLSWTIADDSADKRRREADEKMTWSGCMPTTSEQSPRRAACARSSHRAGPNSACRWTACAGCRAPSRRSAACCALLSFAGRGSIVVHLHRGVYSNNGEASLLIYLSATSPPTVAAARNMRFATLGSLCKLQVQTISGLHAGLTFT